MADHPTDPPPAPGARGPAATERSWQSLAVGLAIGVAVVLLLIAVAVGLGGGGDDEEEAVATSTTARPVVTQTQPATSAPSAQAPATSGPPTTRQPTPRPIVAADQRRVEVLDQTGAAAPRTLFDLGPSTSSDVQPPIIGGVSLSSDGTAAYFDVVGVPPVGALKRVPLGGGPVQELGSGAVPVPSPDGTTLALIEAPEPDLPALLVLRPLAGGAERRIDLGDGTCGNLTWAPSGREVAVDICSGGEPITVALVDIASSGVRELTAPDGTTWSVPAFKPDGTLTLVEQRETDAAVVALGPDRTTVATTVLRRPSTSIITSDWSAAGDLLICDTDGIMVAAIGGTRPQQVATGYTAATW